MSDRGLRLNPWIRMDRSFLRENKQSMAQSPSNTGESDKQRSFQRTTERMLAIVQERLLAPLGDGPVDGSAIEKAFMAAYPLLLEAGLGDPDAVGALAARHDFAAPATHGRAFKVGQLLVRVLRDADKSGACLRRLAMDDAAPWYVRASSIKELGARGESRLLEPLLNLVADSAVETEIRLSALNAVTECAVPGTLPLLQRLSSQGLSSQPGDGRLRKMLILSRGKLGDRTVLRDLIELSYPTCASSADTISKADLLAFTADLGDVPELLTLIGVPEADPSLDKLRSRLERLIWVIRNEKTSIRLWALDQLDTGDDPLQGEEAPAGRLTSTKESVEMILLDCLNNKVWAVAFKAALILRRVVSTARLMESAAGPTNSGDKHLWALFLLLLDRDIYQAEIAQLPHQFQAARIVVQGAVPLMAREYIVSRVKELISLGEIDEGTDVRWMIEALLTAPVEKPDFRELLPKLLAGLQAAQIQVGRRDDRDFSVTEGEYSLAPISVDDFLLSFSIVGPFVTLESGHAPPELVRKCRQAAALTGWCWIEPSILSVRFTGIRGCRAGEPGFNECLGCLLGFWPDYHNL